MENNHSPNTDDESLEPETPRRKRGSEFLSQYLLRKSEVIDNDSDDEESDEPTGVSKRKRFFRSLFRRNVELASENETKREHTFDSESWFSWQKDHEPTPVVADEVNQVDGHDIQAQTADAINPVTTEEIFSVDILPTPDETIGLVHDSVTPDRPEIVQQPAPLRIQHNEVQQPNISDAESHEPSEYSGAALNIQHTENSSAPVETVTERRNGSALPYVLLGAEYLARKKADRNLGKQIRSNAESAAARANNSEIQAEQLRGIVAENRERLERIKRDAAARAVAAGEKPSRQEALKSVSKEQDRSRARETKLTKPDHVEKSASRVDKLPTVIELASKPNTRKERDFETVHEIKDEKGTPSDFGAASVGAIVADQSRFAPANSSQRTDRGAGMSSNSVNSSGPLSQQPGSNEYYQAVKTGFFAGVLTIILGIAVYLMIK